MAMPVFELDLENTKSIKQKRLKKRKLSYSCVLMNFCKDNRIASPLKSSLLKVKRRDLSSV